MITLYTLLFQIYHPYHGGKEEVSYVETMLPIDTKSVEDKYKTGTGEVLRLGQQTKIKAKTASNISHGRSGCTALAGRKR